MRLLHFLTIILFLLILFFTKVPGAVLWLKPYWPDLYRVGDLYRFSYLPEYRDSDQSYPAEPLRPETKTDLFVLGDSYARPFSKQHFPGIRHFSFANWNEFNGNRISIKTDSGARNILIIECSEKHILLRLSGRERRRYIAEIRKTGKPGFFLEERTSGWKGNLEKYLGRPAVSDQNLQMLLFSGEGAFKIKEWKAVFQRAVFKRIASEVEEYHAKKMLLQRMTTDTSYLYMSSFRPVSSQKEEEILEGFKSLVQAYKQAGIDTVIITLIPNPVSVIAPSYRGRKYNQLIPKLEQAMDQTGAGCLSVFQDFSILGEQVYRRGDTHWNQKGGTLWLHKINSGLIDREVSRSKCEP